MNVVNIKFAESDAIVLAAYVLWRLNHIHPFINGNGRTARATCYFVLCLKAGYWLPGETILPELIRQHRAEYVIALQAVDNSWAEGNLNLAPLHALLAQLLTEQLASAGIVANAPDADAPDGANVAEAPDAAAVAPLAHTPPDIPAAPAQ